MCTSVPVRFSSQMLGGEWMGAEVVQQLLRAKDFKPFIHWAMDQQGISQCLGMAINQQKK